MKTLSSPLTTQSAAVQSGWCECYDIYLKSPITTPFAGTSWANAAAITINDDTTATPYPSQIVVTPGQRPITSIRLTLYGVTHNAAHDIDILLVGPTGAMSIVMSDCGRHVTAQDLAFSDTAGTTLPDFPTDLVTGEYAPTNSTFGGGGADTFPAPGPGAFATADFSVFLGTIPDGTWSLYIVDDEFLDTGTITGGWKLEFGSPTTNVLRLTTKPDGVSFFTPKIDPEPTGTQGNAAQYNYWPIVRQTIKSDSKTTNDKMQVTASNVTLEWIGMLDAIDWEDTPFIIRKVSTTIAVPTADDCAVIFSGLVDSAIVTLDQIQFTLSNDLGTLATTLPQENMHTNCRFNWADDMCTQIRFLAANYKSKTAAANCTTTRIFSAGLTEDVAGTAQHHTAVTADHTTDKISLTAHGLANGDLVKLTGDVMPSGLTANTWYYLVNKGTNDFQLALTYGGSAIPLVTNGTNLLLDTYGTDLIDALAGGSITASSEEPAYSGTAVSFSAYNPGQGQVLLINHHLSVNDSVVFAGAGLPSPLVAGTTYYVLAGGASWPNSTFELSATVGGPVIAFGTGSGTITTPAYGAKDLRQQSLGHWKTATAADWGTLAQGYFEITAAQQGLKNELLKPYIQFDLGSNKAAALWRVSNVAETEYDPGTGTLVAASAQEQMCRLILFFSSTNNSTWKFETYFEMPPTGGLFYDVLIPNAQSARYWRVCIRSRWAETFVWVELNKVVAHLGCRNYWMRGRITFDAATATGALQGYTCIVLESYNGEIVVPPLPAAPANGDTFIIERGCGRTFNDCAARANTENFGGFTDIPAQTVIR